jgi:hypothetical protein
LLNDVDLVALQGRAAVEDVGGGIFFEVPEGDRIGKDESLVAMCYLAVRAVRV